MGRARRLLGLGLLVLLPWLPHEAPAQAETQLGAELCSAARAAIPAGSRIVLAPPAAADTPLPVAEVEAIMSRAAQAMCADWPDRPRILAGSSELQASLALIRDRQGPEAWRKTFDATVRQAAEFVLVGETGLSGGAVTLRLTLVALEDGQVIVKTPDIPLTGLALPAAGDPRAAIADAVRQFQDTLPAAREDITVGRFANEVTGLETAAGRALAEMVVEAWLDSANSITAMLRDAAPAQVHRGDPPEAGFALTGTVRLIDRDRFQLVLRLTQDGVLHAARTLDLSTLQLPPQLRELLDPAALPRDDSLSSFTSALSAMGKGTLRMVAGGGRDGAYPICRTSDARRLMTDCRDSLIRLSLTSDIGGELLCLSLDDSGLFYVMLPSPYAPATRLRANLPLTLPDDLPLLADGNQVHWPAMGPPSDTLVGCLVYPRLPGTLMQALDRFDGKALDARDLSALRMTLRDSAPAAAAAVQVRIID
ncbi:hypothetical protein [Maliponia aquimaris]|uniref:DUF4384 domain-containing protein n=1 Tax=Maliponia aquimaris TaxID=1673631 RepID=A0A238K7F9_9RHOB|nr:hypothetical protein [Maliponia aquimaris]SMX38745.1 hypothetical protein MAA8898_01698 [Maliponia aquimaris]